LHSVAVLAVDWQQSLWTAIFTILFFHFLFFSSS